MENNKELLFNKIYKAIKKLSSGSFGVVYNGKNLDTNELIALKLEKTKNNKILSVLREGILLQHLQYIPGIPKYFWSGSSPDYDVLVLTLLGNDLSYYMKNLKKLSLKSVVCIGKQLLVLIEKIHQRSIIHRDLKPENIVMGQKDVDPERVYIVDFGISKFYRDSKNRHIPYKENKPFIGTTRYASINAHIGIELTRKDDLESIGYILVYLYKGILPWQNLNVSENERTKIVGKIKEKIKIEELCKDMPEEFTMYFKYVKGLTFQTNPEYGYLINLMNRIGDKNKFEIDNNFEFIKSKQIKSFDKDSSQKKINLKLSNVKNNEKNMKESASPKMIGSFNLKNSSLSPRSACLAPFLYVPSIKSHENTFNSNITLSAKVQIDKNLTDINSSYIIDGFFSIFLICFFY